MQEELATLTAEREQLRAQLETASGNARLYAGRCEELESTAAGLRRALEWQLKAIDEGFHQYPDGRFSCTECSRSAKSQEAVRHTAECASGNLRTALAASPDDHERRIKAEALRSTAAELEVLRDYIQTEVGPDDARDDIRRVCWNRAKDLREEADRLDAEK